MAFDIVHGRILRFFPELVRELGGCPEPLLSAAGLDPEDGGATASYGQLAAVLKEAATTLGCPDLGLRLARRQGGVGVFGPLGRVMRNSRTFGDALTYVAGHAYAHSPAAAIWLKPLPADGLLFVGHDILLDAAQDRRQTIEQILLAGHLAAVEITGGSARARRVHFRHQPLSPRSVYRRHFRCEVRFGCSEDGLFFANADLASPIVDSDAQAYRAAATRIETERSASRAPMRSQAAAIVDRLLGAERCTSAQVAAALGLHPRTLHRRLRVEGTSFQRIKDGVRRDRLLHYLHRSDLDIASISERLGFAEQSVLTRQCNRWFAASPSVMRARGPQA